MNDLKFWKWPEIKERLCGFYPIGSRLPDEILSESDFERKTRDSFVAGRESFFSPFKGSQPLVWEQLMTISDVEVVQNRKYPELVDIAAVLGDGFFFIEPFSHSDDEEYWRELMPYLPEFLMSYFTNFNGIRASRYKPSSPGNLPSNNRKWRRVSDYVKEENIAKRDLNNLRKVFASLDELFIFLEADWGDLAFLDFSNPSKKIYVVPQLRFAEYFELENAAHRIDCLCAHIISGATTPFYLTKS